MTRLLNEFRILSLHGSLLSEEAQTQISIIIGYEWYMVVKPVKSCWYWLYMSGIPDSADISQPILRISWNGHLRRNASVSFDNAVDTN